MAHSNDKHPRRVYPEKPLVGVGAVIHANNKILFIRRANEPGRGLWSIPGGLVEVGETLRDAVKREVEEETGVKIEVGNLIDVMENIIRDEDGKVKFHYILVNFEAKPITEDINISSLSEVLEARWFTLEEIKDIPITNTARLLLKRVGIEI